MASVTLRDSRDGDGARFLEARLDPNGELIISGQDLGPGVEAVFGEGAREYEWTWTIGSPDVARLAQALGGGEVLALLAARFSGDAAAGLARFLDEAGVPRRTWSRVGD